MDTLQRVEGALVGFALGETLGATVGGVETPVVTEDVLPARTGTAQVVVVAHAVARIPPGTWSADAWFRVLSLAFADDDDDRLLRVGATEPERSGVDRLRHGLTPRADPATDAGTAVVRALPVGWAVAPARVGGPARAASALFHCHPTAIESAITAAWVTSLVTRGVSPTVELIDAARVLLDRLRIAGDLDRSLADARAAHDRVRDGAPLAASDVYPSPDRAGGVLGLGLLGAALAGPPGPEAWEAAVLRVARIGGARLAAAVTGSLLGAAWGFRALPAVLVGHLQERDALIDTARAVHARAEGMDDARLRAAEETGGVGWTADPPGVHLAPWADPVDGEGIDAEWLASA